MTTTCQETLQSFLKKNSLDCCNEPVDIKEACENLIKFKIMCSSSSKDPCMNRNAETQNDNRDKGITRNSNIDECKEDNESSKLPNHKCPLRQQKKQEA